MGIVVVNIITTVTIPVITGSMRIVTVCMIAFFIFLSSQVA